MTPASLNAYGSAVLAAVAESKKCTPTTSCPSALNDHERAWTAPPPLRLSSSLGNPQRRGVTADQSPLPGACQHTAGARTGSRHAQSPMAAPERARYQKCRRRKLGALAAAPPPPNPNKPGHR